MYANRILLTIFVITVSLKKKKKFQKLTKKNTYIYIKIATQKPRGSHGFPVPGFTSGYNCFCK